MNKKLRNDELNRLSVEEFKEVDKVPLIIALENVRSLHNIGSVFRTADAFCIEAIYLCGYTARPPHKEINKTALGATDSVHWRHFPSGMDALEAIKGKGYTIASLEQAENTTSLNEFGPEQGKGLAVFIGNEVKGVTQEVVDASDCCLEIPQFGTKHSLNVSVCAGVLLWDLYFKMQKVAISED